MAAAFLPSHFHKMKFGLPINKVARCQVQSGHMWKETCKIRIQSNENPNLIIV